MTHDLVVIGAGIIGLASALRYLELKPNSKVVILDKEKSQACHQTGNNSGVLHSGVYYKPDSLKAKNCRRGYGMMVDYCQKREINFDICGKVIVATQEEQRGRLKQIYNRGYENGLEGLKLLSASEVKEKEPHVRCVEGIWVPQAGIVDYKLVAQKMMEDIKFLGGEFYFSNEVKGVFQDQENKFVVETYQQSFHCHRVLNCGGLYSDRLAAKASRDLNIRIIPFRGEYYNLREESRHLVKGLIYPVPDMKFPFLGVHFTTRIDGTVEAGPNAVFAFHREGYSFTKVNMRDLTESLLWPGFRKLAAQHWKYGLGEFRRSLSKRVFLNSLQELIPELEIEDIVRGGSGVRAQACYRDGELCDDFVVLHEQKNFVNVCNAPSPAATSSLAIGSDIAKLLN